MRKLIEMHRELLIECDNCDYNIPLTEENEKHLVLFINSPCPKCGTNLLTEKDWFQHVRIIEVVDWINKWFSWITMFYSKNSKTHSVMVHVHEGVTITPTPEFDCDECKYYPCIHQTRMKDMNRKIRFGMCGDKLL